MNNPHAGMTMSVSILFGIFIVTLILGAAGFGWAIALGSGMQFVGGLLNLIAIRSNKGHMPVQVRSDVWEKSDVESKIGYIAVDSSTRLKFLCDRWRVFGFVLSMGDIFSILGFIIILSGLIRFTLNFLLS